MPDRTSTCLNRSTDKQKSRYTKQYVTNSSSPASFASPPFIMLLFGHVRHDDAVPVNHQRWARTISSSRNGRRWVCKPNRTTNVEVATPPSTLEFDGLSKFLIVLSQTAFFLLLLKRQDISGPLIPVEESIVSLSSYYPSFSFSLISALLCTW